MNIRKVMALLLVLALSVSLVACGGKSESSAAAAGGEKKITFWSVFTGGDGAAMQSIIDAYNATSPEYTVEHIMVEQNDLYTKLPLIVNSQEGVPDLVIQHVDRLAGNAKGNMYQPLNDYIATSGKIQAENYVESTWNMGEIDGNRYGIPLDLHSFVTYYNKDLVAKYCPTILDDDIITFEEIAAIGDTVAADGITTYALTWARCELLSWYYQLNGVLSEDGEMPSFNNEKFEKIFNDLIHDVSVKWCTQDGDQPNNLFAQGKLMFLPEGSWLLPTVETMGVNYGVTYMISYDENNMQQWASSHHFAMPRNKNMTEEKALAIMDFVNFVGENSYEWATVGQVPAHKGVLADSRINDLAHKILIENPEVMTINDYLYYGAVLEALDKIAYDIPFQRITVQEGLASAEQTVVDVIRNQ